MDLWIDSKNVVSRDAHGGDSKKNIILNTQKSEVWASAHLIGLVYHIKNDLL